MNRLGIKGKRAILVLPSVLQCLHLHRGITASVKQDISGHKAHSVRGATISGSRPQIATAMDSIWVPIRVFATHAPPIRTQ
jgi:hypothetical protein